MVMETMMALDADAAARLVDVDLQLLALEAALDGGGVETKAGLDWDVKAVDYGARTISGLCCAFALDRVSDVIDEHAADAWMAKTDPLSVPILWMHDAAAPPIGTALEFRRTPQGIWSKARIFRGATGDRALDACRDMLALGKPMGCSIGYVAREVAWTKLAGRTVRLIKKLDIREWSLTFSGAQANLACQVAEVKAGVRGAAVLDAELADLDGYLTKLDQKLWHEQAGRALQQREQLAELEDWLGQHGGPDPMRARVEAKVRQDLARDRLAADDQRRAAAERAARRQFWESIGEAPPV
jgi:hypothetical protein